jgi:hypothetical protein
MRLKTSWEEEGMKNHNDFFRKLYKTACFIIPFVLCVYIFEINKEISRSNILSDEYMLNFIGVILGLGITIITYIYTSIAGFKELIYNLEIDSNKTNEIILKVQTVLQKLKEDLIFVFYLFFFSFVIAITKNADIPFVKWNNTYFGKFEFVIIVKLYIFFLTFIAIFDIIMSLFSLLKANEEVTNNIIQ